MPKVSVIIPCYNLGVFLDEAIASVWEQTFADYEIIVVDDGSDDLLTQAKLAELKTSGIQIIKTDNQGVSAARNCGIVEAHGEYILPLDADDRIAASYLQQAVEVLDTRKDVGIVYCEAYLFGALNGPWEIPEFSLIHQLLDNVIFSAALFRREDWEKVGGYDEKMYSGWEDWDYWLRLLKMGVQVVRLPEPLFYYRIRQNSRDRSLSLRGKLLLLFRIIGNHWTLYCRHSIKLIMILLLSSRRSPAQTGL